MRQWVIEIRTESTTWDAGIKPLRFSLCAGLRRAISNVAVLKQHKWFMQYRLRHRLTGEIIYCDQYL